MDGMCFFSPQDTTLTFFCNESSIAMFNNNTRFVALLVGVSIFLAVMHLLVAEDLLSIFGMHITTFDLGAESSMPTWYATALLLTLSAITAIIAIETTNQKLPFARHWRWLTVFFVIMSIEEVAATREQYINQSLRELLDLGGIFHYAWVIPIGILLVVFALAYAQWWWRLPSRVRTLFFVGLAVYVGGAVGMELVEGYLRTSAQHGFQPIRLFVEETLEILGTIVLIYAMLEYIRLSPSMGDALERVYEWLNARTFLRSSRLDIAIVAVVLPLIAISILYLNITNNNRIVNAEDYTGIASVLVDEGLPLAAPPFKSPVQFGEDMLFWGYRLDYHSNQAIIDLRLSWWVETPPDADYSIGVYLISMDGDLVKQTDGPIQSAYFGEIQTSNLDPNHIYVDERVIDTADVPAGEYILALSVYQWWDDVRLSTPDGQEIYPLSTIFVED